MSSIKERILGHVQAAFAAVRRQPALTALTLAVVVPCLLLFSIEARSLRGEIYDVHEWRQGETFSVAYAFVHESASFFYPKHAWRGELSGIVGMEAPIYPYVVSLFMRIFGDSFLVARVVNFTLFLIALVITLRRFAQQLGLPFALGFFVMAAFTPAVLCEFRQMQPDPASWSLSMLAAVYFHDHGRLGRPRDFVRGQLFFGLALLTKPIAIATLPAMLAFSCCGEARPRWRAILLRAAWFAVPLALMFAWDWWANRLVELYMQGQLLISIDHDPAKMWAAFNNESMRRFIFFGLVENYTCHVSLFAAVLLGVAYSMRAQLRSWGVPYLLWLFGAALVASAFSDRYWSNWYYMLPFVPPLLFFGASSLSALFEVIATGARDPIRLGIAFSVVLAAVLIMPLIDDAPWDYIGADAAKISVHLRRSVSGNPVYWASMLLSILIAIGYLFYYEDKPQLPHWLLAAVLALAGVKAMVVPFKDVEQTVRFYTKEEAWEQGRDDLRAMRAAVNRYSTSADRFVMNGYHPGLLARALRVGWADDPRQIESRTLSYYAQHGARFFMSFSDAGGVPASVVGGQVLARAERWELRCIDPKGCPALE